MTDLVVAVRLTAKDGGLVGQLNQTAQAERDVAAAAEQLAAATGKVTRETRGQGAAAETAAKDTRSLDSAVDGLGASNTAAAGSTRLLTAAQQQAASGARQQRAVYQQLGFQVQDVFASFASGVSPLVILAQQGGQTASALSGLGSAGIVGRAATFLAGPFGAAVFGVTTVLGLLATEMFKTEDGSKAAAKGMEEFARRQSDIGNFIDQTTGKLKEQNRTLLQNAVLTRAGDIAKQRSAILTSRDEAFARARQITVQGFGPGGASGQSVTRFVEPEVQRAIDRAGKSVVLLDRYLQELGKRRPDLRAAIVDISNSASRAVLAGRTIDELTEETRQLSGETASASRATASLVEKQVALTTATTPLEKARAQYNLVLSRGAAAEKAGGDALESYRGELTAAAVAVNVQEAAEAGARTARSATGKATREAAKDVRELIAAERELAQLLAGLEQAFDPATAAQNRYDQRFQDIDKLRRLGRIDDDTYADFLGGAIDELNTSLSGLRDTFLRETAPDVAAAINQPLIDAADVVEDGLVRAGRAGARAFRDEGLEAAQAIAQIFGGKVGGALGQILGVISGLESGNFNSVGGRAGGLLTLLGGQAQRRPPGGFDRFAFDLAKERERELGGGGFADGLREVIGEFGDDLKSSFNFIFGDNGIFTDRLEKSLGRIAGSAAVGAQVGDLVGGARGGRIGGAIGGGLSAAAELTKGTQLGGVLASVSAAAPQIGAAIAVADLASSALRAIGLDVDKELFAVSPLGAVAKALFGGAKRGSATIGLGANGLEVASSRGNSGSRIEAATGSAGSVIDALGEIAEAFGGAVTGTPSVSIGVRDGNFRVDPTGRGITKTKNGAIDFGEDQAAAITFATAEAIRDGVITGLSAKVAQALQSSSDLDKAIREALKVEELETLLDPAGEISKSFRDFERQAAERVRIAKKYGFDLVKLEEFNAKERASRFEKAVAERTGALKSLLEELAFGGLGEGTLADQRKRLLDERAQVEADARGGVDGAAERLAAIDRKLIEVTKEGFGSAGPELASTIANARSTAEAVIALENTRVKAAADATAATNAKLDTSNVLANETNDLLAEQNSTLRQILARTGVIAGGGGGGFVFDVARAVALR